MENEIQPDIVGGAMRLAVAVLNARPKPIVGELVYCVADCETGHGGKHIARMNRIRDGQTNIVLEHVPIGGVTLCGAKLGEVVNPYQPARLLTSRKSELFASGCCDCVSEWLTCRGDESKG